MAAKTSLEYQRPPAVLPNYVKAATALGGGLGDGETIPRIESEISGMRADRSNLSNYRKVCGFAERDVLPVTYPHIMAFPIHMATMTHREFPLKLLGLVHVRNEITQHRAIGDDEALDLHVHVGGHRDVHNGVEFDLVTQFHAEGKLAWESTTTMLSRSKGGGKRSGRKKKKPDTDGLEQGRYATWDAPADIGRRYARTSGDFNPIHLSALSAKLFGFPRAIAHGMWMKARTAAELEGEIGQEAHTIQVAFKKPVLLPSSVVLKYQPEDDGIGFLALSPDSDTVHMTGGIKYLGN